MKLFKIRHKTTGFFSHKARRWGSYVEWRDLGGRTFTRLCDARSHLNQCHDAYKDADVEIVQYALVEVAVHPSRK